MPGDYIDRFLEVLNSTFLACDENGTGFVETNRLIDFLISQEPSWMDNETIREEFYKVLHGDLYHMISKEDFIKSLQGWFEASLYQDNDIEKEENINSEAGKFSSSTSGIGETSDITSGTSTNSMEEIYSGPNFVTDEQTFTNEDLVDETSLNDSGSSQAELRLVKVLQSEISTLLRKNEYLENLNDSLLAQVTCLEDTLVKKKDESENYKKQLIKTSNHLELQTQKHEETESRINLVTEENKLMAIQMSQCERENAKLKTIVSHLEEKLENSSSENIEKHAKLEEITNKFNTLNNLHNNTEKILAQERANFKFKEIETENALREVITENRNLQSQLDSNTSYTEDIKCKLRVALKELSDTRIKNVMEADSSCLSADNLMVLFDENVPLNHTIPFETSLLAELKDEVESDKRECCCVCKQNVSLNPRSSDAVDAAVSTYTIETVDQATMTTFYKQTKYNFCSKVEHKDVGEECSSKRHTQLLGDSKGISTFLLLASKRSIKKWASLFGVILILSLLLVFFFFHILLSPNLRRSHKPMFYVTAFFDTLHVHLPIK